MTKHTPKPSQQQSSEQVGPNPSGLCMCGCGQKTRLARQTHPGYGWVRGEPMRYIAQHQGRKYPCPEPPNPSGLCMCGCGQTAPISTETDALRNRVKGEFLRYIAGHFKTPIKYKTFADHFWAFCTPGKPDECWDWQGSLAVAGYGHFNHRNKTFHTHRISWEIHYGPIPEGLSVLHKCDRRSCNNPEHLFLGTQTDNIADMVEKGRSSLAKLNTKQVISIRAKAAQGNTHTEIATEFSVCLRTISDIVRRATWKHI